MGEIIKFDNSINKNNNQIMSIFKNEIEHIKNIRSKFSDEDEDIVKDLDFLEGYLTNLTIKYKEKNWKTESSQNKFINSYNCLKSDLKDEDDVWKAFFFSEFIYFSDINSGLIYEDDEYIKMIINAIDNNMQNFDINNSILINKIINDVRKSIIKNLFHNDENDETYKMVNVVEGIVDGFDLLTIFNWYKDDNLEDIYDKEDLQNGILTIDRIYNYYKDQEEIVSLIKEASFYSEHGFDEKYDDSEEMLKIKIINGIKFINNFPEEYKLYFIQLVRRINSKKSIDEELYEIIKLTNLYLSMGEQITEYDFEDLNHYLDLVEVKIKNKSL
ncbi:MAG: hypothetical protein J6O56_02265 [Bacilli bacterium]|nr:hypothetical protein [Bacilli bacterium]